MHMKVINANKNGKKIKSQATTNAANRKLWLKWAKERKNATQKIVEKNEQTYFFCFLDILVVKSSKLEAIVSNARKNYFIF